MHRRRIKHWLSLLFRGLPKLHFGKQLAPHPTSPTKSKAPAFWKGMLFQQIQSAESQDAVRSMPWRWMHLFGCVLQVVWVIIDQLCRGGLLVPYKSFVPGFPVEIHSARLVARLQSWPNVQPTGQSGRPRLSPSRWRAFLSGQQQAYFTGISHWKALIARWLFKIVNYVVYVEHKYTI